MWLEIIESYDINLAAFIDVIKPELNDINNKNGTKSINYIELQENNEVKKVWRFFEYYKQLNIREQLKSKLTIY